ncbi:hypothetical protein K466DRAFT_597012 [Polyporus arcularius HHB13444]|uniref:Heterokaryon incompatibility domain-containing protein n=1 Tax=Polyporus arcularius HHB13444 TaxID=1314778 RepID=A0A5C3PKT5_9APHY|nr:hypothetical protein K466DRAFT_597012 [Polyporus arcularius HHB13444]
MRPIGSRSRQDDVDFTLEVDAHLLRHVCHIALGLHPVCRYLWIEELCVNPAHDAELRININSHIFQHASHCFISPLVRLEDVSYITPTPLLQDAWTWLRIGSMRDPAKDLYLVVDPAKDERAPALPHHAGRPDPRVVVFGKSLIMACRDKHNASSGIFGKLWKATDTTANGTPLRTLYYYIATALVHAFFENERGRGSSEARLRRLRMMFSGLSYSAPCPVHSDIVVALVKRMTADMQWPMRKPGVPPHHYLVKTMLAATQNHPFWLGLPIELPPSRESVLLPIRPSNPGEVESIYSTHRRYIHQVLPQEANQYDLTTYTDWVDITAKGSTQPELVMEGPDQAPTYILQAYAVEVVAELHRPEQGLDDSDLVFSTTANLQDRGGVTGWRPLIPEEAKADGKRAWVAMLRDLLLASGPDAFRTRAQHAWLLELTEPFPSNADYRHNVPKVAVAGLLELQPTIKAHKSLWTHATCTKFHVLDSQDLRAV